MLYIRSHLRSKVLFNTVTIFIQHFLRITFVHSLVPDSYSFTAKHNMADGGRQNGSADQTQVLHWQDLYQYVSINRSVLNEILGNIRLLHGQWTGHHSSNCTNPAVYSLTTPEVLRKCRTTEVFNIRGSSSSSQIIRFCMDKNSSNASCFTVDIKTSCCRVWAGGDNRLLDDFG